MSACGTAQLTGVRADPMTERRSARPLRGSGHRSVAGGPSSARNRGVSGTVGIVANPVSGKDIRRLVANAPSSTLQEKYTIVRRLVLGAAAAGADRFWFLPEPHHICARAIETLALDGVRFDHVPITERFDESDTVRTVAAMRDLGCAAVIVLGGDGTCRAATLGWRDVPLIGLSTGTNNVFPRFVEATVAGEAAGLVAAGHVELDEVAVRAKVVEVTIGPFDAKRDGGAAADHAAADHAATDHAATGHAATDHATTDLALIDAVLVDERFVGSRALFDPAALRTAVLSRSEPASVGVSSIGGLVVPCGAADEGGVVLQFGPLGGPATDRTVRAPMAPGWYAEVGLTAARRLVDGEAVEVRGPAILAFDGERQRMLRDGQCATLRVCRSGPRVIDVARALQLGAERGVFVHRAGR